MDKSSLLNIIKLRAVVGYLGEVHQAGWWQSQFFMPMSANFLDPVFGRMAFAAQYYGVKEAASKVHDDHIGIGKGVFHLFRLPETLEREMHGILADSETVDQIKQLTQNHEAAENFLRSFGSELKANDVGPVCVGSNLAINDHAIWSNLALYYLKGFLGTAKIFPYFMEAK